VLKRKFLVTASSGADQRLDAFLSQKIKELSRSLLQKAIEQEKVRVNRIIRRSSYRLKEGDTVEIEFELVEPEKIDREDLPLEIIYKDKNLLVIDKPSGMVVHPGTGNRRGTLVNALLFHFPQLKGIGPEERPGIVHRLDKETSGIMVIAKTMKAYQELQQQFKKQGPIKYNSPRSIAKSSASFLSSNMPQNSHCSCSSIGLLPTTNRQVLSIMLWAFLRLCNFWLWWLFAFRLWCFFARKY